MATTSVAKFGVYNSATEEAFNKWQDNRNKQYFTQNSLPDASSSDESNTNFTWFMDLLKEIVDFFRSFF